ncbi:hypothetical protein IWW38_004967, partial [Coemansia aciculifera]
MDYLHENVKHMEFTQQLVLACVKESKQEAETVTSTWDILRSQYPPVYFEFAPLASASTNNSNNSDAAFSQAATMTTYAVELLRLATASQDVDSRCIEQATELLMSLCNALITTRDETRGRRVGANEQASEHSSSEQHKDTGTHRPEGRTDGSEPGLNRRWHPYHRGCSLLVTSRKKSAQPTTLECVASPAVSDLSLSQAPMQLPADLDRQQVVRAAFLRQGFTESGITAYFELAAESSNVNYASHWKHWATWCIERGLDPKKRSEAELRTCITEHRMSGNSKKIAVAVRGVWSIVGASQQVLAAILKSKPRAILPEGLDRQQ